ncbi:MAG: SDR family NAD(P)-dependent oxidoreductase [Rhizobacter sp.]|nr:SDR family NAD(P)-dependent oxidoreductase [Ferruginibacter sp.]
MILVTGGSGLLGAALIETLLKQGKKVKAIYNKTALQQLYNDNLLQVQCDILDVIRLEEVMEEVEQVYHCAGLVSFHKKDVERLYKINVEGTANMVDAAVNAGVKKMLHVSSVAALGRIRVNEEINEKMQWTPETSNSRYGQSKYLGEMEMWRGIAEGLNAVIVNPTIILGPGNWNDGSTAIFKSAWEEFPWYTTGTTGFVDVRDVVNAMVFLMDSPISGEKFIVSGHNETYQDIFNTIADAFQKKRPHKKVTPFLASLITTLESLKSKFTGKAPLVTRETAATAMAKASFDSSKLLQFLPGFQYHPLSQTIEYSCRALQQKLNNQ